MRSWVPTCSTGHETVLDAQSSLSFVRPPKLFCAGWHLTCYLFHQWALALSGLSYPGLLSEALFFSPEDKIQSSWKSSKSEATPSKPYPWYCSHLTGLNCLKFLLPLLSSYSIPNFLSGRSTCPFWRSASSIGWVGKWEVFEGWCSGKWRIHMHLW